MAEIISHLLDQPLANLVASGGLVFLFIAAVGKISGKIEPDTVGRIICGVFGLVLLGCGLVFHVSLDSQSPPTTPSSSIQWKDTRQTPPDNSQGRSGIAP